MAFLTDLDEVLRQRGVKVKTHAGWKTRGYAGMSFAAVRGTLWHHTATHRSAFEDNDAPTLNLCINGRSDLPGPLCQIVLGRDGTAHVIAAGWGNHAGTGSYPGIPRDQGNAYLIGVEMESSGVPPYDWTLAQLQAIPVLRDALRDGYGHKLDIGHMEYSDGGKIDPAGLPGGMNWLRTARANTKITAANTASVTPIKDPFEEILAMYKDRDEFEARMAKLMIANGPGYENEALSKDDMYAMARLGPERSAYLAIREPMTVTDWSNGEKVKAQQAAFLGTTWNQVHRRMPAYFKEVIANQAKLLAMVEALAQGSNVDMAAVEAAAAEGARKGIEEWEQISAEEIANAVVDEQAERLIGGKPEAIEEAI